MLKESELKLQPNDDNVTLDLITGQKSSLQKLLSELMNQHIIFLEENQSVNIDLAVWQFGEKCTSKTIV